MTQEMDEAIVTIRELLNGTGNMWEWDDFLSVPPRDPEVAAVQGFCRQLRADYPPLNKRDYCSEAGKDRLRAFIAERMRMASSRTEDEGD